jgi:glycerol-3-phosphate dehydrogenase
MGGKWTTHRAMAEDTIHRVEEQLGLPRTESTTRHHVLSGGAGYTADYWMTLSKEHGISESTARHLASKLGTAAEKVLVIALADPPLMEPLLEGFPAIRAEVVHAAREELAANIEDVLARRIGLQLFSWRNAIDAAPAVGELLAGELGWTKDFTQSEVSKYVDRMNHLLAAAGVV